MKAKQSKPLTGNYQGNNSNSCNQVGYCKPPKRTQFKPGQSGNPAGRPRGSRAVTLESILAREAKKLKAAVYASQGMTPGGKYIPDDQRKGKQSDTHADWTPLLPMGFKQTF